MKLKQRYTVSFSERRHWADLQLRMIRWAYFVFSGSVHGQQAGDRPGAAAGTAAVAFGRATATIYWAWAAAHSPLRRERRKRYDHNVRGWREQTRHKHQRFSWAGWYQC